MKGKIALNVGICDQDRLLLEDSLSQHEMVNLHTDTAIEALAVLAEHQVDVLVVDESIDDIDVDSFVPEARKRQENMAIVVVSVIAGEHPDDYSTLQKPIGKAEIIELLRKVTVKRDSGVDYRLIERLSAKRDKDRS